MTGPLAMFPLGAVVLPGELLPLHVFEPRYRTLVDHCLAGESREFGTVLISRGREVGGGDQRNDVGTVVRLIDVRATSDDTLAVVAVGARRIRVRRWLTDDPYPRAEVADWPDESNPDRDAVTTHDVLEALIPRARRVIAQAVELGDLNGAALDRAVVAVDGRTVGQMIAAVPLGALDRYALLCAAGEPARAETLARVIAELDEIQRFRLGLPNMDP